MMNLPRDIDKPLDEAGAAALVRLSEAEASLLTASLNIKKKQDRKLTYAVSKVLSRRQSPVV